jgi:dipeptidyl aminopeptidase/acylaminoacyl peptidase
VFGFCHAAGRILAAVADPADPCRIVDLRSVDGEERVVFAPNRAWLADRQLSEPRKFALSGAGGVGLDGWLMPPIGRPVEGSPCILLINRGRFGWSFNFEAQLLAGRGFAVAYVNPSGSYGYGEGFRGVTHYDAATAEVDDILRAVDALVQMGIDGARVGASGSSFGGFMVNWLVSHHPERFAAAVAQASYCNRHSLWGTSSIGPSRWDRPGPPWEHAAFLLSRSPLSFAASVRVPVLIVHGDRDTICPIEQAEQWYSALTILGRRPAWLILEGEGHDLARGARPISRIRRMTAVAEWFERHLGAGAAGS